MVKINIISFFKQLRWIWLYALSFTALCLGFFVDQKESHLIVISSCVLFLVFIIRNFKLNKNDDFKKSSKILNLLKDVILGLLSKQIMDFAYYNFLKGSMLFSLEILVHIVILQMIILFVLYENYKFSIPKHTE